MPVYEYQCPKCHAKTLDMRKVDERFDGPRCPKLGCDGWTTLILSPVAGVVKNPAVPKGSK